MRTLNEIYQENEENNNHIENARLVVMCFGTKKELEIIERVIERKNPNSAYSSGLYNTIIKTALNYESKRIEQGDSITIVDGQIIK